MGMADAPIAEDKILILYDGVCGLCNGVVAFLVKRDDRDQFRFAPLQSELGRQIVARQGCDPDDIDTVYAVIDVGTSTERAHKRSRAILRATTALGGAWRLLHVFRIVPAFILDLGYRLVAKIRYGVFGQHDTCPIPDPSVRHKFVA